MIHQTLFCNTGLLRGVECRLVFHVPPSSGRRPGMPTVRARALGHQSSIQGAAAGAMDENRHFVARVVGDVGQFRFDRVLHGSHHLHACVSQVHDASGHRGKRSHVHVAIARSDSRYVHGRQVCVDSPGQRLVRPLGHQKSKIIVPNFAHTCSTTILVPNPFLYMTS